MDALIILFFFYFGAVLASFAGVIAERLGTGQFWHRGRSRCNACGDTLSVPDLLPILSYLLWRGRCRMCTARVPFSYPLSELLLGIVFVFFYQKTGLSSLLPLYLLFSFLLTILVLYDIRHTIVPFKLSLLFVLVGAGIALVSSPTLMEAGNTFLIAGSIGALFYLLHLVSSGRWMGLGDTPVALGLSLAIGERALAGLLFSFWSGAVIGILILVLRAKGRTISSEIPFVPFLALGYFLALLTPWSPLSFL